MQILLLLLLLLIILSLLLLLLRLPLLLTLLILTLLLRILLLLIPLIRLRLLVLPLLVLPPLLVRQHRRWAFFDISKSCCSLLCPRFCLSESVDVKRASEVCKIRQSWKKTQNPGFVKLGKS